MDLSKLTVEEIKEAIKEYKNELAYRKSGFRLGNVVKDSRGMGVIYEFDEIYCKASVIKNNGEIGTKTLHMYYGYCEKLYDSYEEFKSRRRV